MRWLAAALVAGSACARIQPPPGGPEDRAPPFLVAVSPDSLRSLPGFDDPVEFQFDEIISEGAQPNFGVGTGTLEQLVLLSPTDQVPRVRWRRHRITVRPREGWQPNTVYRVELLSGVVDLRNNAWRGSVAVTFTTGTELPTDTLRGRVVDWTNARPVPQGLVEAVLMPDSLVYRTTADSSGWFTLGPLPRGEYLVSGGVDQNRNRRLDSRESFDSLRVAAGVDSVGELWAFVHDSVAPRLQQASVQDSISIMLTFNRPMDPAHRLPADSVSVRRLPDSTAVPVEAILRKEEFDSVFGPLRDTVPADTARVDTLRAPPDTAVRPAVPPARRPPAPGARIPAADTTDRAPLTSRPPLSDRLYVRIGQPLEPGTAYVIEVRGARTVSGIMGSTLIVLDVPARRPPEPRDTAAAPPDTTPPPPVPPPPVPPAPRPAAEALSGASWRYTPLRPLVPARP